MAQVDDLAALQDLDDDLARETARLREIRASLQEPEALLLARRDASEAEQTVASLRRSIRELEHEVETVRAKREAGQRKLYGGEVSNPRDLRGLEAEAEALARRRARLEDDLLKQMLDLEQASEAQAAGRERLAALEAEFAERNRALIAEAQVLQAKAEETQARLRRLRQSLPSPLLTRYDTLKARKGGKAIARMRRDVCLACGVQVPTNVAQRAQQRQDLVPCPSCSRLLCPG